MSDLIFVYGALRKGASNDWRMKDARSLGIAEIAGTLVKIGWYPGLVLGGEGTVLGEVYEATSELLADLDLFEGIGPAAERNGEYSRLRADVTLNGKPTQVWIYEWLKGTEGYEIIKSGDWL